MIGEIVTVGSTDVTATPIVGKVMSVLETGKTDTVLEFEQVAPKTARSRREQRRIF